MKLFSRTTRSIRLNGPLPIDPETDLYSRNFFLLRLKEERERAKRTGKPFSLLVVDVDGLSMLLQEEAKRPTRTYQSKVIQNLLTGARKIDVKGWFDVNKVGIILPYTGESSALAFKDKISNGLKKNWSSIEKLNLEKFFQTFTFGSDLSDENGSPLTGHNPTSSGDSYDIKALYADILNTTLYSSLKGLAKRILDIIGSLLGIFITSPLMLIIALLIKLTSPGPVLFVQERIGFLGRTFAFLKFRSMFVDADQKHHQRYVTELINGRHDTINHGTREDPLYKMNDDPRVTPLGRILRKTSLDELPQLFNILKGEMSLVGPRPPIQYEVEQYRLWHSGRFFEVKPGLTGLWQISGRSTMSFDDMVRLDLHYADNWSLSLDFKIIFKTFWAVLSAKGAY
jgi:lipopolysaccharide/colanic/teichoic acid biosynthesis glycosyltransferase